MLEMGEVHPGGNTTGLSVLSTELTVKRLELLPRIIMNRAFIGRWTRMPHSTEQLSASASSHHSLSSAAFITNIAESDFRHAQPCSRGLGSFSPARHMCCWGHYGLRWRFACLAHWPMTSVIGSTAS